MDAQLVVIDSHNEFLRAKALVEQLMRSDQPDAIVRLRAQAQLIAAYERSRWPCQMIYEADAKIIPDTASRGTLEDSQALLSAILPVVDEHPPDVVRVALLMLLELMDCQEEQEAEQTRSRT